MALKAYKNTAYVLVMSIASRAFNNATIKKEAGLCSATLQLITVTQCGFNLRAICSLINGWKRNGILQRVKSSLTEGEKM